MSYGEIQRRPFVFKSAKAMAVGSWALNWNSVLDLQIVVVLDDEKARAVRLKKIAETNK